MAGTLHPLASSSRASSTDHRDGQAHTVPANLDIRHLHHLASTRRINASRGLSFPSRCPLGGAGSGSCAVALVGATLDRIRGAQKGSADRGGVSGFVLLASSRAGTVGAGLRRDVSVDLGRLARGPRAVGDGGGEVCLVFGVGVGEWARWAGSVSLTLNGVSPG